MSKRVRETVSDGLALGGAGCVTVGAWQVYPPAAWIVGGALLLVLGLAVWRSER